MIEAAFLTVMAIGIATMWITFPGRQERRNELLRLKIEELRLRDELLKHEGRESELK